MPELFLQKYATSENRTIFLSCAVYTGAPVQGDKLFYPHKENPAEQNKEKKKINKRNGYLNIPR